MNMKKGWMYLSVGLALGVAAGWLLFSQAKTALAGNDRHEDYIICTGPFTVAYRKAQVDPNAAKNNSGLTDLLFGNDKDKNKDQAKGAQTNTPANSSVQFEVSEFDGVWLLDYRAGKLLGTVVNIEGRVNAWAEVDLVSEFDIPPRQNVHFIMTTGMVGRRSALYVAETTTGKFGVYTMSLGQGGQLLVGRHDMVMFRGGKDKEKGKEAAKN